MVRVDGKGHRSSGEGGSLPQGPFGQIDSCLLVEWRCLNCLQKYYFGYRVSSLFFVILSWNWAFGVSSSSQSRVNSPYAAMPILCASWMSLATCRNSDKLTFIMVERVRPVIFQKLHNGLNVSFIPCDSRHVRVLVTEVTHSTSNHFSEPPHIHTTVLRSEVIPVHSSPIQAKAFCASCCLCISVDVSSIVWTTGMRPKGFWLPNWTLKPPFMNCWCTSGWSMGRCDIVA